MHRAGLKKKFLQIDDADERVMFCYAEKGCKVLQQSSLIFIHGFSSDKHAWTSVIKNIPDSYHCIAIDMPGHGESVGFDEEHYESENTVEKLKLFFDKLNLTEPMCFIGTSMGASIVSIFATKYSPYVSMICLLAPVPPGEEYETEILSQLRSGMYHIVLPTTPKQLYASAQAFSMRKIHLRRLLAKAFLKSKLSLLDQHKIVLKSAFEKEYPYLHESYQQMENLECSALIIWGRQDKLCAVEGAYYFFNLILKSELIIFEDCGHMITADKPKETTNSIIHFWKDHRSYLIRL